MQRCPRIYGNMRTVRRYWWALLAIKALVLMLIYAIVIQVPNSVSKTHDPTLLIREAVQYTQIHNEQRLSRAQPPKEAAEPAPPVTEPPTNPQGRAMRAHIRETCLSLGMMGNTNNLTPYNFHEFLVDDERKLLFCMVPKVASTTWRRVFLQLSGKLDVDAFELMGNDVHNKHSSHLTFLSDFTMDEIKPRLRNYFKFVFVREPFERLLSAYKSKFLARTSTAHDFRWKMGRKIISKYRKPEEVPANNTGEGVRFEEFVAYLLGDRKYFPMNEHWDLFYKLCLPCHVHYDYVGKLETINEDADAIMKIKSLPEKVRLPPRRALNYGGPGTKSYLQKYYRRLTPTQYNQLYKMYQPDFRIFNYSVPIEAKPPN